MTGAPGEQKKPPGAVVGSRSEDMPPGAVAEPAGTSMRTDAAAEPRRGPGPSGAEAPRAGAPPAAGVRDEQGHRPYHLSQLAHRQVIGYLGLLLPLILLGLAAIRETTPLPRGQILDSVSDYYYSGAVAAFIGILFALALFLLTYRGYEGDRADRVAGFVGGLAALGVAFFPTGPPEGLPEFPWWSETTRVIHYVSATVLFVTFIVFSLWLFRKTDVPEGAELPPDKRWRNRVYLVCGLVMIAGVLWAASSMITDRPIFWPEVIALLAFAISWLVKGEADESVASMLGGGHSSD